MMVLTRVVRQRLEKRENIQSIVDDRNGRVPCLIKICSIRERDNPGKILWFLTWKPNE